MVLSQSEQEELVFALTQEFRPTTPINRQDLFQGRKIQADAVLRAINQNGNHIVIYGERGVGKTSLANMIALHLRGPRPILAPHINCTCIKTYSELWDAILIELGYIAEKKEFNLPKEIRTLVKRATNGVSCDLDQQRARMLAAKLGEHAGIVFIFDEFDALEDNDAKLAMAETIKLFSDRNVPATIVIVGVADDVRKLIEGHASVERSLEQIQMPRMSRDEVEEIVSKTLGKIPGTMSAAQNALHEISRIAKGLPHYAHSLGLNSAIQAVKHSERVVSLEHVEKGMANALSSAQASILDAYMLAITSTKKAIYKEVLLACALVDADEFGYFAPAAIRTPLSKILGRTYKVEAYARHLHAFCEPSRGPVLMRANLPGRARYRFANPLVEPFVLMKGLNEGILTNELLSATRNANDPLGRLF